MRRCSRPRSGCARGRRHLRRDNAMLFPSALVASPDGSRLIFTVAVPHEDCPC
jgi:hypothetical protein